MFTIFLELMPETVLSKHVGCLAHLPKMNNVVGVKGNVACMNRLSDSTVRIHYYANLEPTPQLVETSSATKLNLW